MKTHKLKIWPEYFVDVKTGRKTFELRRNDRDFKVGDKLILEEYNPRYDEYSGHLVEVWVSYIFQEEFPGIDLEFCVLGIVK